MGLQPLTLSLTRARALSPTTFTLTLSRAHALRLSPLLARWGFEQQGVVPDIVTMGKPMGNGMPLAAVVCTRAVSDRFARGPEYFNTFGGNPVCTAAGLAVLTILEREGLREHAAAVGLTLRRLLARLAASQDGALIGYHP